MDKWTKIPHGYPVDGSECLVAYDEDGDWVYVTGVYASDRFRFYMPHDGHSIDAEIGVAWIEIEAPE